MRRLVVAALLLLSLILASAPSSVAAYDYAVPAGCQDGTWMLTPDRVGTAQFHWFNPLYPMFSAANNYGQGWQYDPCFLMFSWGNTYGRGYNGESKP